MSARVLVVDDIEANRRLMKAKLENRYHTVSLAANGHEALDLAVREEPQIILLDVMMPGMDGYEVCRRLKTMPETRHIPVAMLTALTDAEDRVRGLEAGADDFLSKPIDDESLFARIEALGRYGSVTAQLREQNARTASADLLSAEEQARIDASACIMVLDENIDRARQMAQKICGIGHKVVLWQDAEGQASLASEHLDLIILSLSGQSHDPLRLCANFKAAGMTDKLSILVTYSQPDHMRATTAMGLGASDMVRIPVNQQELIARIRTQLRRQRYVDILRKRIDRGLELSILDQLTGLYNRRYMLNQLEQWRKRSESGGGPVSVVSLDIDHFKAINDRYGHQAGDQVLESFAKRLRQNIRPKDIACRPGGEEFLVIMPETNVENAQMGAERIRHAIAAEPFMVDGQKTQLKVTVSAGVATFLDKDETVAELLHRADQALYTAKQGGRNQVISLAA
ncbi:PleD family two-component system response regulator [Hyphomonas sp. FCG-A18]|uniref:PleD family two-component system response regulator n=1 Tax=Hyphomonas sp. FCG-A18 TaxID=3080019 RepID=UPI002B2CB788|nr:PleD family two-component system response regulator [Hyphomonas sp. FCG-A18]